LREGSQKILVKVFRRGVKATRERIKALKAEYSLRSSCSEKLRK
jgi:hypothetical protein